jgi:hypothetical protein
MNVTMHPNQWFHHHRRQFHAQAGLCKWDQALHHDVLWIVMIGLLVLVISLALNWLMGGSSPTSSPYMGSYP